MSDAAGASDSNDTHEVRVALEHFAELRRALALERSGAPLGEVLQSLLRAARLSAGQDARTALLLVDEAGQCLNLVASDGLPELSAGALDKMPVAPDARPCGRAACLGERVIVEDLAAEQGSPASVEFARRHGIRSCWSFPVRAQGQQTLGALTVYFGMAQQADCDRLEMMDFLAQCAALVIERAADAEHRRTAAAQLRASEVRYRSLVQSLTSIVWCTDPEGRFAVPQPSWEAYTGQNWEQQQDFGWTQAVHPEDRESVLAAVSVAVRAKNHYRADGRLWHHASQTYRHCEGRGVPIFAEDGQLLEWVGTCLDVDDQKQAEEGLRLADRRKDEFIAVLAHELRNPLAPIRNAVFILKGRGAADAQLSWASSIIERQVTQMARLLDDLMDVSRITRNKLELRKTRLTLDSVLESAVEASRPVIEQHGHRLELNVLAGPIYVEADGARLAQVFSNLLNNAAKYTDNGGKIRLTVRLEGNQAVVAVKDNGIGIEPEMVDKLFHMFTQVNPALERSHAGLGIGLALVRGLVEMHAGTVTAKSDGPGCGSEFVVRLPLATMRADAVALRRSQTPAVVAMRILVADDNRDSAETLSVLLQMMGHEVRTGADGQEALEIAAAFRPEVALLDIGMPKVNGYEVARRIRIILPDTVLAAMTGWGQPDDVRKAAAAGFDHHLVKPVNPEQVQELLAKVPAPRQ